MNSVQQLYDDPAALWNGPAGRAWVEAQTILDRMFKPLENLLTDAVAAVSPQAVLDVGCGTGATTLAVARLLGTNGRCTGVDISAPMIQAARTSAERQALPASFVQANAQDHDFEPASYDMMISRFGVMFFDDPVRAFANLRRAVRDDGQLRLIAWRAAAENPFMTTAERAAAPLLPDLPVRKPDAPGQFAFADRDKVQRILQQSGWRDVDIEPVDVACGFPQTELVRYVSWLGPVGVILQQADEDMRRRVIDVVRPAFDPYLRGDDVTFDAACWMVSARC